MDRIQKKKETVLSMYYSKLTNLRLLFINSNFLAPHGMLVTGTSSYRASVQSTTNFPSTSFRQRHLLGQVPKVTSPETHDANTDNTKKICKTFDKRVQNWSMFCRRLKRRNSCNQKVLFVRRR